jgi:hypothetical protein
MIEKYKWYLSPNIVVVRFPPLAGGQFFISMLSYFNRFMFPLPFARKPDHIPQARDYKNFSHGVIMNSVPEREIRHWWSYFESAGGHSFWGYRVMSLFKGTDLDPKIEIDDAYEYMPDEIFKLLDEYICFISMHEVTYEEIKNVLPNCKIINLVNNSNLQNASYFKEHHNNSIRTLPPIVGPDVYNFDMSNVFNKEIFFAQIKYLANLISKDKTYDPRMELYYDKYINVHLDN